jgi:hypothetical protein
VTEEKSIKSNEARVHFRDVLDDAGKGIFTSVSRWNDPPAAWVVPDDWFQRAKTCLSQAPRERPLGASEALHHFRGVLDDAEEGVFTAISRWGKPTAWVVSAAWYQLAQARLAGCAGKDGSDQTNEERKL